MCKLRMCIGSGFSIVELAPVVQLSVVGNGTTKGIVWGSGGDGRGLERGEGFLGEIRNIAP